MAGARPGPAPLPSNVVALRGNPGKRHRDPEPAPVDAGLDPPDHLTPGARAFWKKHAPEVARLGMLTVNDVPTFSLLAEAWAAVLAAKVELVPKKGMNLRVTTTDRAHGGEKRKHPAWQIYRDAVAQYLGLAREFGFSPSSRVGLPAVGADGDEDDDLFD